MEHRTVQLVLQYDGSGFAGWQRQPTERTVQGELEAALERLTRSATAVLGAGRTDAGVHARGQAAGIRVPERWSAPEIRRALNAVLPADVWVAAAYEMRDAFHARFSATLRSYSYLVGLDESVRSPFRSRYELALDRKVDPAVLATGAAALIGEHSFRAFAVQGTAPDGDDHRCRVSRAVWEEREGGLRFEIEANRFLHHMVRFLVGTMLDAASGRREPDSVQRLLQAADNREVSPPAPPHALFLDRVKYPSDLYL